MFILNIVLILLSRCWNPLYLIALGKKRRVIYFISTNCVYLLVIDYFSRWLELSFLNSEEVMSDGGRQFSSLLSIMDFIMH